VEPRIPGREECDGQRDNDRSHRAERGHRDPREAARHRTGGIHDPALSDRLDAQDLLGPAPALNRRARGLEGLDEKLHEVADLPHHLRHDQRRRRGEQAQQKRHDDEERHAPPQSRPP
jgi:hypothetical protein